MAMLHTTSQRLDMKYFIACLHENASCQNGIEIFYYQKKITPLELNEFFKKNGDTKSLYKMDLYIPFCERYCDYCKYYKLSLPKEDIARNKLIDQYISDISSILELFPFSFKNKTLSHLDINGGTPLLLNENQLDILLQSVHKNFSFQETALKTIEATPRSITTKKLKLLKKYGFTLIGLGVQTISEEILNTVNRRDNGKEIVAKAIQCIRESNIPYIQAHLIIGLPNDTINSMVETLEFLCNAGVDEVEVFILSEVSLYLDKHFQGNSKKFNEYVLGLADLFYPLALGIAKKYGYTVEKDFIWSIKKIGSTYFEIINPLIGVSDTIYNIGIGPSARTVGNVDFSYKWDNEYISGSLGSLSGDIINQRIFHFRENTVRTRLASKLADRLVYGRFYNTKEFACEGEEIDPMVFFKHEFEFLASRGIISIEGSTVSIIKESKQISALVVMFLFGREAVQHFYDPDKQILKRVLSETITKSS